MELPPNPMALVRLPVLRNARDRRLEAGELERLESALMKARNSHVRPIIRLEVETGLRRAEILALEWRHINLGQRTAHVPWSKTGQPRTIPLTDSALAILAGLERRGAGRLFPLTANAFRLAWERVRRRAGLGNLRFHDLRHEAISRFAEMGLNMPELALISGHRDYRMLQRYTHLRPTDLARKLAGRSWADEIARRC
jgi:integrase